MNVRICTKHCVFSGKRKFRWGEKQAHARDGLRRRRFAVESCSKCAHSGTEGSKRLFLFFAAAVLLCFACVETLCALELVHHSDVLYSSALQFYCVWQLSLSDRSGMAASGCLERYMISSSVLRLYCVLQVFLADRIGTVASWMRFECYRICTKHCVSSGKRRFRCGEKLARLRDGFGRRRFGVESCSICARSGAEGSR